MPTTQQEWQATSYLGTNAAYLEEQYAQYVMDPTQLSPEWQRFFEPFGREAALPLLRTALQAQAAVPWRAAVTSTDPAAALSVWVNYIRMHGHRVATVNPLATQPVALPPEMHFAFYGLASHTPVPGFSSITAYAAHLQACYMGPLAVELGALESSQQAWWFERMEQPVPCTPERQLSALQDIIAAEGLEKYLASQFPGAKRFSLEGAEVMIPALKHVIRYGISQGIQRVVMGMPHRGRLNALVNILGKPPQDLFAQFAGKGHLGPGSGDVKYHEGYDTVWRTAAGEAKLSLAYNPSHLEIVNPVVMGMAKARGEQLGSVDAVLPITLHGDSAFTGQGVVAETFNLSQTTAYSVGGTLRVVINNQVGFTTATPSDVRSNHYCTDIAKMLAIPILHVNGDDVAAVLRAMELAMAYRTEFHRDVVIDIQCYRRHGHNEADEPSATQPLMYQLIRQRPTLKETYALNLVSQGVLTAAQAEQWTIEYRTALEQGQTVVAECLPKGSHAASRWQPYLNPNAAELAAIPLCSAAELMALGAKLVAYPAELVLQKQVDKLYQDRRAMYQGTKPLDWGAAEMLAYGSLVAAGLPLRLTGQDCGRGTFFHRHAVIHDQVTGQRVMPLRALATQAPCAVHDSVLSEEAVLAFEYGYACTEPLGLTLWEAQFGDFANGAQVVIDQFLAAGEQKWGRYCGLTLLLPHGYEGQGPEHSSARLERYLQLSAQHNWLVCQPTSAAQIYHLLRQQALQSVRRPLIIITPKSLLRRPEAASALTELTCGAFEPLLPDLGPAAAITRVVLCSGRIYYDLVAERDKLGLTQVAIVRLEQLYPLPKAALQALAERYPHCAWVWCQDEPKNQGAWSYLLWQDLGLPLTYAGRPEAASTAVGSMGAHQQQLQDVLACAFGITIQGDLHA